MSIKYPVMPATIIPEITGPGDSSEKSSFRSSQIAAPSVTGNARRKENSKAVAVFTPSSSARLNVVPEREMAGRIAVD